MTSWTVALPGFSVYGISQTRILEWFAISFSRRSFQPRDWTCVSSVGGQILYNWAIWGALYLGHVSVCFSSVYFSHSFVSDSLQPHGLQHARFPVHHQLPEFTQTHVHWVGDAIQSSHLLSSPSPPTFNLSQDQGLFKRVSSLNQEAKELGFQLQHQSFQWTPRTEFL